MESPLQERVWLVCEADMARTFAFVLHFVGCVTVTMSPNQIIIIIIIIFFFFFNPRYSIPEGYYYYYYYYSILSYVVRES